jgi:hypothetical protein
LKQRLSEHRIHPQPLFIVGHYRSGTTHLHNLLALDSGLAAPSTFQVFFPEVFVTAQAMLEPVFARALPATRSIDAVPLATQAPHEDEFALGHVSPFSVYNGLYFPKRFRAQVDRALLKAPQDAEVFKRHYLHFLRRVSLQAQGRPLLLKNPAHLARIELLRDLFPGARFLHIFRNPYAVFLSTRRFFRRFIEAYGFQQLSSEALEEEVFWLYEQLMKPFFVSLQSLPRDQVAHLCYEDLLGNPVASLASICQQLSLGAFEQLKDSLEQHGVSDQPFPRAVHALDATSRETVRTRWDFAFEQLGYDPEGAPESPPSRATRLF